MKYIVNKNNTAKLSPHFYALEFACPCGCKGYVESSLVEKLEHVRVLLDEPIRITSGYRCQAYQDDLKARGYETAKGISPHQIGIAADITTRDIDKLAHICYNVFKATGTGHTFVHVDLRDDKERRWTYKK